MTPASEARLELWWIPLGAGATVVRHSGRLYEALMAGWQRRPRYDIYHSALIAATAAGSVVIEITPVVDRFGPERRGVVGGGAVGSRWLGRLRLFRYEIRQWSGGEIPDLAYAVESPVIVSTDPEPVNQVLRMVASVPTPVWGRDELHAGEMWNSNSVVSWLLSTAGLLEAAGDPPGGGRAPGWNAGVVVATRMGIAAGGPQATPPSRCAPSTRLEDARPSS